MLEVFEAAAKMMPIDRLLDLRHMFTEVGEHQVTIEAIDRELKVRAKKRRVRG